MKKLLATLFLSTFSLASMADQHVAKDEHHNKFEGLGVGLFLSNSLEGQLTPMVSYRMPWIVAGLGFSWDFNRKPAGGMGAKLNIPLYAGVNMEFCKSLGFQAGLSADLKFSWNNGATWVGGIGAFVGGELDLWKHLALTAQVLPYYYNRGTREHNFFNQVRVGLSYVL